ncbi:MAG: IS200/IS605 family accessory protein TnpB-related protein [Patescibacteria group bacterium]
MRKKAKDTRPIVSYATRVPNECVDYCESYALVFNTAQRCLHAARQKPGFDANRTKREYQVKYGINARQYNGIKIDLDGKESSRVETHKTHVSSTEASVTALTKKVKDLKAEIKKEDNVKTRFILHQKQRRLGSQRAKLKTLESTKPKLCFGSKKLFLVQYNLKENGYKDHAEWKKVWRKTRNSTFILVGSSGETQGNSIAQLVEQPDGSFTLALRTAPGLVNKFGPTVVFENLEFHYDRSGKNNTVHDIRAALDRGDALTFRFNRGKKNRWTVHVSLRRSEVEIISNRHNGRVGIDINNGSLDAAFADFEGNMKAWISVPFKTSKSANHDQIQASIGEAVKQIIAFAVLHKAPVVIENLDFTGKKKAMKDQGLPQRSMLSDFSYSAVTATIKSRAWREGIEVFTVNPAYSSVIGCVKYQSQYGINSGVAAGIVLARRSMYKSERCPLSVAYTPKSPEDGLRHVWSRWAALVRNIRVKAKMKIFVRRHDWFRKSGALSTAEGKLLCTGKTISQRHKGKAKATSALDESSSTNRRKNSSSDVGVKCNV